MNNIINDFCQAWQTLDAQLIIKHLDRTFVYDSQWVFDSLDCDGYAEYIKGKFNTLRERNISIQAEVVDDYCIKLIQGESPYYYRIQIKDDKVIKGVLCMF